MPKMIKVQRRFVIMLLIMALPIMAAPPAQAEPVPKASSPSGTRSYTISGTAASAIKKGAWITWETTNGKTGVDLDYRIAKRRFSSISSARQFAAGWDWSGGTISHVSSYERRKIDWHKRRTFSTPLSTCRGVTRERFNPEWKYDSWIYLDSCQTNKLLKQRGGVVIVCGVADKISGKIKHPVGWGVQAATTMCITFFGLRTLDIAEARANSPVGGVVVGTKYVSTRAGIITTQTWRPQWRSDR